MLPEPLCPEGFGFAPGSFFTGADPLSPDVSDSFVVMILYIRVFFGK
jgi:hypothetical protein